MRGEVEQAIAAAAVLPIEGIEMGGQGIEAGRIVEVQPLVDDPFTERVPGVGIDGQDPAVLRERGVTSSRNDASSCGRRPTATSRNSCGRRLVRHNW